VVFPTCLAPLMINGLRPVPIRQDSSLVCIDLKNAKFE